MNAKDFAEIRLTTPRLLLRPVVAGDAADLFEYAQSDNVGIHAGWPPHTDIEDTRRIMETVFLGQEHVFGIVLRQTGKLIGTIGLAQDPKRANDRALMLGYALGEAWWGNGYTTEAAREVIRYGFGEVGLDLISVYCYPHNERSKRVIEKCGFQYEGRLRQAERRFDGEVLDNECYSLFLPR